MLAFDLKILLADGGDVVGGHFLVISYQ
jgi:hypothetical protein